VDTFTGLAPEGSAATKDLLLSTLKFLEEILGALVLALRETFAYLIHDHARRAVLLQLTNQLLLADREIHPLQISLEISRQDFSEKIHDNIPLSEFLLRLPSGSTVTDFSPTNYHSLLDPTCNQLVTIL
jgi:hypothetical protein